MTQLTQVPGVLDISVLAGDDLSFNVEMVGIDLTGYTLEANIIPAGTASTSIPIQIITTDVTSGKLHFFISKTSMQTLPLKTQSNKWLFQWTFGGLTRGILGGYFYIQGD